jgi:nucleotide-binding universal stress UspA family protein
VLHHPSELAHRADATVHVLSIVDDAALGVDVRSTVSGKESGAAATDAVETVASTAEARGVTNVVTEVEHGTPDAVIVDHIEAKDVHAVGTGTTGRRGTERILLGSVAEKTVRSAPVPAMTVAHQP